MKLALSILTLCCSCYELREVTAPVDSGVSDATADRPVPIVDAEPVPDAGPDAREPVRFESFERHEGAMLDGFPGAITFGSGLVASASPWRAEPPFALVVRCPVVGWGFECSEVTIPDGSAYLVYDPLWTLDVMLTFPDDVQAIRMHIASAYARRYDATFEILDASGRILESTVIAISDPEGWATSAVELRREDADIRTVRITPADGTLLIDAVEW